MEHLVIFSDLDGSLLDFGTYQAESAHNTLRQLQQLGTPVVFTTAKTQAEVLYHQDILGIHDPFIVENGSALAPCLRPPLATAPTISPCWQP